MFNIDLHNFSDFTPRTLTRRLKKLSHSKCLFEGNFLLLCLSDLAVRSPRNASSAKIATLCHCVAENSKRTTLTNKFSQFVKILSHFILIFFWRSLFLFVLHFFFASVTSFFFLFFRKMNLNIEMRKNRVNRKLTMLSCNKTFHYSLLLAPHSRWIKGKPGLCHR